MYIKCEDAERYFAEFLSLNRFADFKNVNIDRLIGKLCERIPSADVVERKEYEAAQLYAYECGYEHFYEECQNCKYKTRQGKWIKFINNYGIEETKCSICGNSFTTYDTYGWNYCYNCGADMRDDNDDD